jgi:RNA polymerase sigma-70 factor (ECF subfamily)
VATDEALYARVREGDRGALAELVTRYHAPLLAFLYRMTNEEQTAEDLVQETFVKLMTHGGTAPRTFKSWVYTVARNLAYDAFRSASYKRETHVDPEWGEWLPASHPGVEKTAQRHADRERVGAALQELRPHHREVLVLRYYHDLSLKEIAEVVGAPLGTVKSRLHHALKQAKFQLEYREVLHAR